MNPIPSPGQGRFLPPGASTLFPSSPALHFDPINTKFPTPTYSSIKISSHPVFPPPLPKLTDFKFSNPERYTSPAPSPSDEKAALVFLLTFVWIGTALTVSAIAREKGFAKRYGIPVALIGATAVTTLTYANVPMGLASMAIIMVIGCFVCKPTLSSPASRDVYDPYLFHLRIPNWQPPVQPLNFHPIIRAEDVRRIMRLHYGPFNPPNDLRVAES
jgi:hypothetical protein